MKEPTLAAVVAMNELRVIGREGALPWRNAEDMAHFKAITMNTAVIMGRKTWISLPEKYRPLPNRINIVVTRAKDSLEVPPGVVVCSSPEEAIARARELAPERERICVIGGAEIYRATIPLCDEVYLTIIPDRTEGDAFLPPFEESFRVLSETDGVTCRFYRYVRS